MEPNPQNSRFLWSQFHKYHDFYGVDKKFLVSLQKSLDYVGTKNTAKNV